MDKKSLEEAKAALLEMNELVSKLDPSVRAAAFDLLRPHYFGENQHVEQKHEHSAKAHEKEKGAKSGGPSNQGLEVGEFIARLELKTPADNVLALAAWLYSVYGAFPIAAKDIRELGGAVGLIIPARPDNTMRQAQLKGKHLFSQQGKGWQPTISGEIHFKDEYKVTKGSKPRPKADK